MHPVEWAYKSPRHILTLTVYVCSISHLYIVSRCVQYWCVYMNDYFQFWMCMCVLYRTNRCNLFSKMCLWCLAIFVLSPVWLVACVEKSLTCVHLDLTLVFRNLCKLSLCTGLGCSGIATTFTFRYVPCVEESLQLLHLDLSPVLRNRYNIYI